MKKNYPKYFEHRGQHLLLKKELKKLSKKIQKESASLSLVLKFAYFFTSWFLNHIKKDKRFGEFLKEKNNLSN